jgi:rSAM/selenodomain-associated transferase 1
LAQILVIAKAPVPGRAKTRLCPPCTAAQAASLAEAALTDTLTAVAETPCEGRVLVLEGAPGPWLPAGFEVVPQRGDGLGERLAAAFAERDGPALLIGMDTPQVRPELLSEALAQLERPGTDAVLGPCEDGGYWAIGMRSPDPRAFDGVPMSSSLTGACQRRRLGDLGLRVAELPTLRDVDYIEDARGVAAERPGGRFARTLETVEPSLCLS